MKNYPLIKVAIFFSGGILFSKFAEINSIFVIISAAACLVLAFLLYRYSGLASSLFLFISLFFAGFLLVNNIPGSLFLPEDVNRLKNLIVYGRVDEIKLIKDKELTFHFETDSLSLNRKILSKKIKLLCRIKETSKSRIDSLYNRLQPGNYLKLSGVYYKGREMRNPGEFDYNKYLNSIGISGLLNISGTKNIEILNDEKYLFKSLILNIRKYIDNEIKSYHNKSTASLLKGLLLADRSEIDYVTKNQFINAGVIHILAVSGLHVGFVALVFIFLFGRFNIHLRSFLTITGLLFFMFITGVPPSVFRATLMSIVIITGFIFNRSTNLFNSLALAGLIILVLQPEEIFNPGFQLSFSAVLGIAIIYPPLSKSINRLKFKSNFIKYLLLFMGVSLSAQIGTLPFTLMYFGKLSVISLLANLIVIPLSALIVGLGIMTLIISGILPFIAVYFAAANDLITKLLFIIVEYSGSEEFSYISIMNFSLYDALIFYLFLFLLFFCIKRIQMNYFKLAAAVLIILNFYLFSTLDNRELLEGGKLSIFTIDVGQGDAILLKFPKGTTALIDAGNVTPGFDNGERIILPLLNFLKIKEIDYAFVSHIDSDHYAGFISLVNSGVIKNIYKPELDTTLTKDIKFEKYLNENNIPLKYYKKEKILIDDVPFYILNNEEVLMNSQLSSNDKSGVFKIVYGKTSFLFTGDIEKKVERIYSKSYKSFLDADLLKTGHHGSKTSSTYEFLKYITPEKSVISAGILNKFNHPSEEVLKRLEEFGSEIYRTDKYGALIFQSDGETINFIDWKKDF